MMYSTKMERGQITSDEICNIKQLPYYLKKLYQKCLPDKDVYFLQCIKN